MRSSVSYMLSHNSGEPIMSHPDYAQQAHHHASLLLLIRGIGQLKPKSLQRIFERVQAVNNIQITDSTGIVRDIWIRYVRDHPVENNDWGDFQTHRKLLGLITVGKFDTQIELNELCRIHESLKVKYTNTLYDSRCLLFGPSKANYNIYNKNGNSMNNSNNDNSTGANDIVDDDDNVDDCLENDLSIEDDIVPDENDDEYDLEKLFTTPNNFKSRPFFYPENDVCVNLEQNMMDFLNSLFWILESKRLERKKEKIDRVQLLLAPFEKKDFIGLDLESRNNKKRCMGRVTKNLADLTLQSGLIAESLNLYHSAGDILRAISDSLWLGAANEGLCAASAILLYPNIRLELPIQLKSQEQPSATVNSNHSSLNSHEKFKANTETINADQQVSLSPSISTSSTSSITSTNSNMSSTSSSVSSSGTALAPVNTQNNSSSSESKLPMNVLPAEEITSRYRDAIINYSKYRNAGIIETEAALKASRICILQRQNLDVSMFLQNVLYINLNMNELERVRRFETLTELYQQIGYHRKAAFCQRLAAWRHVAQSNSNPNWKESYRLMLESFPGHKLSLDPIQVLEQNTGWPTLQIDLLHQIVATARRLGLVALATRHMTFLLQTMWKHLTPHEQREMSLQLQNLSAQCEGSPVSLILENGTVIPPANLTNLPICMQLQVRDLVSHLRPLKVIVSKVDCGPFLFTPIHFNNSIDRRTTKQKQSDNKINFVWVQNDLCEVTIKLINPLPFDLEVTDIRLLTTGIVFESIPQTVVLQPNLPIQITLHGTPLEVGELEIQGYSTHTLGVKSNCYLKNMLEYNFPKNYLINTISSLPKITAKTSLPQTATFASNDSYIITSACCTIYNGEYCDCLITLINTSNEPIDYIEMKLQSTNMDVAVQNRIFQYNDNDVKQQLPIKPNQSIEFNVRIYGEADFLGSIGHIVSGGGANSNIISTTTSGHDGPNSLIGNMNNLSISGNTNNSRMSSPIPQQHLNTQNNINNRRNDLITSSFRSSTTNTSNSGHSSLATLSLCASNSGVLMNGGVGSLGGGPNIRHIDAQLRIKYSNTNGLNDNYCRQCAIAFNVELLPSAHITNWDVLPAETSSQFYLVLDVINLTAQEMALNYTSNKNILIEAKESCRVPVPVERCPLERILLQNNNNNLDINNYKNLLSSSIQINNTVDTHNSLLSGVGNDGDIAERICSEHIAEQVNLKWTLPATETSGVASLKGISLSANMLDLITVAPLQWEVKFDDKLVSPQSEVTCVAGQFITMGVCICNLSPLPLQELMLSIQFYQDYQNGIHNYRLETRVTMSGPNEILVPILNKNEKAFHECSVIFFTPGRFKADIQCRSQTSSSISSQSAFDNTVIANKISSDSHVWRFIPPIEITVVE